MSLNGFLYALGGLLFIFAMTSIGSLSILFYKKDQMNEKLRSIIYGFSGGIMLASSIFSLLLPSIKTHDTIFLSFTGFFVGGLIFIFVDRLKINIFKDKIRDSKKLSLVFLSMTLHNIPEGLSVGLSFALAMKQGLDYAYLIPSLSLAFGIGIQNIPEGLAIALPLHTQGFSKPKAISLGVVSGAVEPIFGLCGFLLIEALTMALPFLLALAAGAMMIVTFFELFSEVQKEWGKIFLLIGFLLMMGLDVLLEV